MAKKVSKRTGNRRLLKLAELLLANAKNRKGVRFDIRNVGLVGYNQPAYLDSRKPVELNCNTIACAMGLASISGAFKNAGLSYCISNEHIWNTINGRTINFDDAAVRIFGITKKEALWLFGPLSYVGKETEGAVGERAVAARIKHIVAGKGIVEESMPSYYINP